MIPKVIHYCWVGGKPLPQDAEKCIKSWKKYAPDCEIKRWDETNFDINSHPFVKKAYEEKCWAFVTDYMRLRAIFDEGGIYLDTDVELIKPIDSLLDNECYLGIQQIDGNLNTGIGFGAVKNNSIIERMLKEYDDIEFDKDKMESLACPNLNTKAVKSLGIEYDLNGVKSKEITIYPADYFDPYSAGNTECLLTQNTVSIHHYSASWTSKGQRFKRKIVRIIGPKMVSKVRKLVNKIRRR